MARGRENPAPTKFASKGGEPANGSPPYKNKKSAPMMTEDEIKIVEENVK
ncbi:MAG: hypothetical protein FWE86_00855 [Oscillospiraceae bacterium]|nr:hypothetical protein [Oscillospiraceae bacterium]